MSYNLTWDKKIDYKEYVDGLKGLLSICKSLDTMWIYVPMLRVAIEKTKNKQQTFF